MGPPGFDQCIVMPLVANLTDDNATARSTCATSRTW
jgi:hypothetical protein